MKQENIIISMGNRKKNKCVFPQISVFFRFHKMFISVEMAKFLKMKTNMLTISDVIKRNLKKKTRADIGKYRCLKM